MGNSGIDAEADIQTNWGSAEIRNEFIQAQVGQLHQTLGVPQQIIWERYLGYTPSDVEMFEKMKLEAQRAQMAATVQAVREGQDTESADMQAVVRQYQTIAGAFGGGNNGQGQVAR
jgi:hypothetical protein